MAETFKVRLAINWISKQRRAGLFDQSQVDESKSRFTGPSRAGVEPSSSIGCI